MTNLELLEKFLEEDYKPKERPTKLKDYNLDDYILLRVNSSGHTIFYLSKGAYLWIPWSWIDIFTNFEILYGNEVIEGEEYFEKLIYLFTNLLSIRISSLSKVDGKLYLDILGDIAE